MNRWFRDLKISGKLGASFGTVLFLTLVLGVLSWWGARRLQASVDDISQVLTPSIVEATTIRGGLREEMVLTYRHILDTVQDSMSATEVRMKAARAQVDSAGKRYLPLIDDPDEQKAYDHFLADWNAFLATQEKVLALSRSVRNADAIGLLKSDLEPAYLSAAEQIMKTVKINVRQTNDSGSEASAFVSRLVAAISIAVAIALGIGLWMGWILVRMVSRPIEGMVAAAARIGDGDLSDPPRWESADEVGRLADSFRAMNARLRDSLSAVSRESEKVRSASESLADVGLEMDRQAEGGLVRSESLSAAATEMSASMATVSVAGEQASSGIERVAAAIEEMASSVSEIARSAGESRVSAREAVGTVQASSRGVQELAAAAQEINRVVEAIAEISEQTKLLALNATIEAARAGEAGKGFAVVAGEVKELAKGTADASEDIRRRIAAMQESTTRTVQQILSIETAVGRVDGLAVSIAAAVEQQSATTREIAGNASEASRGMSEISRMVAQAAATSSEVSTEAEVLRGEAASNVDRARRARSTAGDLSRQAQELQEQASRWRF